MPNLVHSLDSTSLVLVFYFLKSLKTNPAYSTGYKNYLNFYSVHDCFAVTANDVDLLIDVVRKIYIDLYSENKYIDTFDNDIIDILKKTLGTPDDVIFNEETRELKSRKSSIIIKLPPKPSSINHDKNIINKFYQRLSNSILLIN